jgi:hypothetical protein
MGRYPAAIKVRGWPIVVPWPFGILRVSPTGVRVFTVFMPWRPGFLVERSDVTKVLLKKDFWGLVRMTIEDGQGAFARITVGLNTFGNRALQELTRLGYPVTAEDKWLRFRDRWHKKGWSTPGSHDPIPGILRTYRLRFRHAPQPSPSR